MASKADVHALYQQAVQCVEAEIDFVDETFAKLRRRRARRLREDFCGTASAACEWVRRRRTNRAVAVDIDARGPGVGTPAQRRAARAIGVADRAGPRRRDGGGPPRHGRGARDELQLLGAAHPRELARLLHEGARCAGRRRHLLPRRLRRVRRIPGDEGDDRERGVHLRVGPGVVRPHYRPQPLPHPLPVPPTAPGSGTPSSTSGGCGPCPRSARSWRKRASAT